MPPPNPSLFTRVLSYLTKQDLTYSRMVHQIDLGPLDYLLAIPGLCCSSHCVPGILALTYLSTSIPLGLLATAASVATVATTEPFKKQSRRDRPAHATIHPRLLNLRSLLTNFSFPSGDSAQAATLGLSFFLYCHYYGSSGQWVEWAWLWLLLIPTVMFSRVYFGCHWIGDVLAGASIGSIVTALVWLLWLRVFKLPMGHIAGTEAIRTGAEAVKEAWTS